MILKQVTKNLLILLLKKMYENMKDTTESSSLEYIKEEENSTTESSSLKLTTL